MCLFKLQLRAVEKEQLWQFKFFFLDKGPAIKEFMPLVVIIGAHDVLRNFWIL